MNNLPREVFTTESLLLRPEMPKYDDEVANELKDVPSGIIGTHWGQRKLAMALIHFIVHHWDSVKYPKPTFVYVGAASGRNIGLVSRLFPEIQWALYDPNKFDSKLKSIKNITIYTGKEGFFTDETAEKWKKEQEENGDVFLISDIRNIPDDNTDYYLRTQIIVNDLESQQGWCRIIQPVAAQLKFPFIHIEKHGVAISNRYFKYMPGLVYLQAWNRHESYETRLVVTEYDTDTYWDLETARAQILYVNKYLRPHIGNLVRTSTGFETTGLEESGLDDSWDASAETLTWANYLIKNGAEPIDEKIRLLAGFLSQTLGMSLSGKMTQMALSMRDLYV